MSNALTGEGWLIYSMEQITPASIIFKDAGVEVKLIAVPVDEENGRYFMLISSTHASSGAPLALFLV